MKTYDTCEEVREEFSALLDGELAIDEQDGVENHLSNCSDCLRELDGLKRVNDLYADMPAVAAPDDFEIDLTDGDADSNIIDLHSAPRESKPMSFRPLFAAAATLALLAGVSYMASRSLTAPESMDLAAVEEGVASSEMRSVSADMPAEDELSMEVASAPMQERVESFADDAGIEADAVGGRQQADALMKAEPTIAEEGLRDEASSIAASPPPAPATPPAASGAAASQPEPHAKAMPTLDSLGFTLKPDRIWYGEGYVDQAITIVTPGTDEHAALMEKRPELERLLLETDRIVFEVDEAWYRITDRRLPEQPLQP